MMSLKKNYKKKFKIYLEEDDSGAPKGFDKLYEAEKFRMRTKRFHRRIKERVIRHGIQNPGVPFTRRPNYDLEPSTSTAAGVS